MPMISNACYKSDTIANPLESLHPVDVVEESEVCVIGLAQFKEAIIELL